MEEQYAAQYAPWNAMAKNIAYGAWAIAVLIVIGHIIRLATMSDAKAKYDFINKSEIMTLWVASIILIIGCCFFANSAVTSDTGSVLWIFVRGFTTVCMGLIVGLIVQNLLKFYYPFFIEKR